MRPPTRGRDMRGLRRSAWHWRHRAVITALSVLSRSCFALSRADVGSCERCGRRYLREATGIAGIAVPDFRLPHSKLRVGFGVDGLCRRTKGRLARRGTAIALQAEGWPGSTGMEIAKWADVGIRVLESAFALGVVAFGGAVLARRWVAVAAGVKFRSRAALYLTIPAIAGLLNWATNQLAVWMIFNPLEFRGIPLISRARVGEPLGWGGWQGIVPAKVEKMAGDIVDLSLNELLDVKQIFGEIDENVMLEHMQRDGRLIHAVADAAAETRTLPAAMIHEARLRAVGGPGTLVGDVLEATVNHVVLRTVRKAVVNDMHENKALLCELFQRCGKAELRFIVDMGLWGGLALGLVQMGFWLLWSPKWTLTAGGAAVGYMTNLVALKVMFEPVEPWRGPPVAQSVLHGFAPEWQGVQGLFLTRQDAVSQEFAEFMARKVLTPQRLWEFMLLGVPRRGGAGEREEGGSGFEELLVDALACEPGLELFLGGRANLARFAKALRPKLMPAATQANDYLETKLGLQDKLARAMRAMPSAKFERVLHPIFEEDELTLILVGAVLGGLAGYGQTFFY